MTEPSRAWYREPYVWLVLAPLIAVIIAGFTTLGIAIEHGGDTALPGEYRNAGKLIALDVDAHRRSVAIAPAVSGLLEAGSGRLEIDFGEMAALPDELQVMLLHPTLPERDRTATLQRVGLGRYVASFEAAVVDRGELHIYPQSHAWRVVAGLPGTPRLQFRASRR